MSEEKSKLTLNKLRATKSEIPKEKDKNEIEKDDSKKTKRRMWGIAKMFNKGEDSEKEDNTIRRRKTLSDDKGEGSREGEKEMRHQRSDPQLYLENGWENSVSDTLHQSSLLNERNWENVIFKGVIVVNNKYGEILDSFDVFPDKTDLLTIDDEKLIDHEILGVDTTLKQSKTHSATLATSVSFYYYLRYPDESRYDWIFAIQINLKNIVTEFKDSIKDKQVDLKNGGMMETIHYCQKNEVRVVLRVFEDQDGNLNFIIREFLIKTPLLQNNSLKVNYPKLTTKTVQNFWFRLDISRVSDEPCNFGPFFPSEQNLIIKDSHYYIEQEIPIEGLCIIGSPNKDFKKVEKTGSNDFTYTFNYYIRDKTIEENSLFCLASVSVTLAEIIRRSQGHQKKNERFQVEKQIDLGIILVTLHFYVREELIPEPTTTGQPVNPLDGYWILERVSYGIRC